MNARRREQTGWYFYDWANSAFSTTVVTLFLGPYLTVLAKAAADTEGYVHPLGIPVDARAWWGYLVSLSVATQVVFLPVLGAMADYSARKKTLLAVFAYAGAAATIAMYWLRGEAYVAGGLLFLTANLSFGASCVVYNSYLPQIAAPEERDAVSSKGWGMGYLGGGLLLALNLALYMNAGKLGLSESQAVRISLASAGVWWAVFTLVPLGVLGNPKPLISLPPGATYLSAGFRQVFRDAAGPAPLSPDAAVPRRLPALQRRHPGRYCVGGAVRQRRAEDPALAAHPHDSDGTVRGIFRGPRF